MREKPRGSDASARRAQTSSMAAEVCSKSASSALPTWRLGNCNPFGAYDRVGELAWSKVRANVPDIRGVPYQRSSWLVGGRHQNNWQAALLNDNSDRLRQICVVCKDRRGLEFSLKGISNEMRAEIYIRTLLFCLPHTRDHRVRIDEFQPLERPKLERPYETGPCLLRNEISLEGMNNRRGFERPEVDVLPAWRAGICPSRDRSVVIVDTRNVAVAW